VGKDDAFSVPCSSLFFPAGLVRRSKIREVKDVEGVDEAKEELQRSPSFPKDPKVTK